MKHSELRHQPRHVNPRIQDLEKEKLRHSLGRPSRSDFVQSEFVNLQIYRIILADSAFVIVIIFSNQYSAVLFYGSCGC